MKLVVDKVIYVTEGFLKTREQSLYNELMKEFKNDLEDWNAYNRCKNVIRLFLKGEPDVLFEKGESMLSKIKFKSILDDFFPRYAGRMVKMEEFQEEIIAVRIEGHTSNVSGKKTRNQRKRI